MTGKKVKQSHKVNTESKIKAAARIVFLKKGFNGTQTRDIAKEANVNLALINYYFRSKQKLFDLIMLDTISEFYGNMGKVFNDTNTTFENKIKLVAEKYIDLINEQPDLPFFIYNEIKSNGIQFMEKLPSANTILESVFIKQFKENIKQGNIIEINPLHFLMNLMGMLIHPFLISPVLKSVGNISDKQFDKLMQERKTLIPIWLNTMLKTK